AQDLAVDPDADQAAAGGVAVGGGGRHEVVGRGPRGAGEHAAERVAREVVELVVGHVLCVPRPDAAPDLVGAVAPHVVERREALGGSARGEPWHRALEDVAVVLVDAELLARPVLRLEVAADAERTVGIDAPRQLDPELVLLPDLSGAGAAGVA